MAVCAQKRSLSRAYNRLRCLSSLNFPTLSTSYCDVTPIPSTFLGSSLSSTKLSSIISINELELRSPESSTSSSLSYTKWFLTAVLGVGAFLYFKKSALSRALCKEEFHGPSVRSQYNFIADAVRKASPFVVHIDVSKKIDTFFGSFPGRGAGSGFVVENGEYVLTNAHVVSGADKVEVKLSTGEVVQGEVTDLDQEIDLALIKMDLPNHVTISPAVFVSPGTTSPGEWVVALGSPFALSNTITCGVVSTIGRPGKDLGLDKGDMEYIQTDASITVGNSGGPLVNLDGEVIGINAMTAYPGISFAIPSERAEAFLRGANKETMSSGRRDKSKYLLGVSLLMLNQRSMGAMQFYYSIPREVNRGIFLANVSEGGAADNAGLKKGDVIVKINDREVTSMKDLTSVVAQGKRFSVEFFRRGKCMKCYVTPEYMGF